MQRGTLSLANVKMAVLDEADRMLDMGFIEDVQKILAYTPEQKQMLLFSATMPEAIVELVNRTMVQPEMVNASPSITVAELSQHYVSVDPKKKLSSLCALLKIKKPRLVLVFVRTKRGADTLHKMLLQRGFRNVCLHGDLSQSHREKHMSLFRDKKTGILVATDVAARGLDVDDIDLVVNYNLPEDEDTYVHRVGRTARAGKKGDAVSFVTNVMEKRLIEDFALKTRSKIAEIELFPGQKVTLGDAPAGSIHAGGRHRRMPIAFHSYRG
ncbi:DEAD/DEAH box helicase [Candidatus Micrarchaeota archaeon]|nr:DEAD/DEAH box helicase [Candidatus Micrarchaeota archaeon]